MKHHCPSCQQLASGSDDIVRSGFYKRKSDSRILQRYYCKRCSKSFSAATSDRCFGQKRRKLNFQIYKLLASGNSLRRIAKLLNCNRTTVERKFKFLGLKCRQEFHQEWSKQQPVPQLIFDDMETFEHSKCKPLSITLAVDTQRRIMGFRVSKIRAKGHLSKIAQKKYGRRVSTRKQKREELFKELRTKVISNAVIQSDQDPHYPKSVQKFFPNCLHQTTKGQRGCITGQGELKKTVWDPIFALNHTAAMFRANVNRLFRKTWNTTKKAEFLELHLYIYAHFHNRFLVRDLDLSTA